MKPFYFYCQSMLVMLLFFGTALAQQETEAYFLTDNIDAEIGMPISLTLTVAVPTFYEVQMPRFPTDWGDFTVISQEEAEVNNDGEFARYTVQLEVIPWGIGEISTPLTEIQYVADGASARLIVDPLFINIPSVLDDEPALRLARKVVDLPYFSRLYFLIGAVAIVLLTAIPIMLWRRIFVASSLIDDEIKQPSNSEKALQSLLELKRKDIDWVSQYMAIGEIFRHYIVTKFGISSSSTTFELLQQLDNNPNVSKTVFREARYILIQCDLAKFAPQAVIKPTEKPLLELSYQWINSIEQMNT